MAYILSANSHTPGTMEQSAVLAILSNEDERVVANQVANILGYSFSHIVIGSGHDAAQFVKDNHVSPSYIIMLIGSRQDSVLAELGALAGECVAGTQVAVVGETNDIKFYRALLDCGVNEYFTYPVEAQDIARALTRTGVNPTTSDSTVVAFMSASAGDGSSTVALNAAYSLSKDHNAKTIIVDMDYQFGMTAKNLDLSSPFGIKELFDHPDRGIDATLVERMVVGYSNNLDIIAAPNELKFYPDIRADVIRDLVLALKERYQFVILDLPHIWSPWLASAFSHSDSIILVAQLWLKSVTHASRLLNIWRETGIHPAQVEVAINRSGAKFKEGVTARDFERVCQKNIRYFLPNDIKTVVNAENQGKTILELGKSKLALEISAIAEDLRALKNKQAAPSFNEQQRLTHHSS